MSGSQAHKDGRLDALLDRLRDPYRSAGWAVTREQAIADLGRPGLEGAVTAGQLARILPGVYVARDRSEEHAVRCAAVVLGSAGRLWISGESALHLYQPALAPPALVHAIAPPDWHGRPPPWLQVRRVELPERWSSPRRLRCPFSEIALLDAWTRAAPHRREGLIYEALWCKVVDARRLAGAASSMARLPDRRRFDSLMTDFLAGSTSPAEVMARREVFTDARFAELEWHVGMRIAGRDRVADAIHRRARIDLELDGEGFHGGRRAVARDRERDTEFAAAGWQPVRLSFRDLRDRPEWCREALAHTIASRLSQLLGA